MSNLKKPACASKRDVLELATLRYIFSNTSLMVLNTQSTPWTVESVTISFIYNRILEPKARVIATDTGDLLLGLVNPPFYFHFLQSRGTFSTLIKKDFVNINIPCRYIYLLHKWHSFQANHEKIHRGMS